MYVLSYPLYRQFWLYRAEILQTCPGSRGDGSYIKYLYDLSTYERFVKPAVVHAFWGMKLSLPLALLYQNLTGYCKES